MTLPPTATPEHEVEITLELVERLVRTHAPQFTDLPLAMGPSGWDNVLVRLGDSFAARLPRREVAARISTSELDWLPVVGAGWTFPAPVPLAVCPADAAAGYPWRWSIVPWLDGTPALTEPLSEAGATDLGAALAQVHVRAPAGAPHNPFRSQSLESRAERFEARLTLLAAADDWRLDDEAARAIYVAADPWQGGTWCHLDLHGNNVLTGANEDTAGRLAGLIDWGDGANGDAATDLGQAWYLLGTELFQACAEAYTAAGGAGDPAAPRVRAEAVAYAATMASLDDKQYAASGWTALEDLGVARR